MFAKIVSERTVVVGDRGPRSRLHPLGHLILLQQFFSISNNIFVAKTLFTKIRGNGGDFM